VITNHTRITDIISTNRSQAFLAPRGKIFVFARFQTNFFDFERFSFLKFLFSRSHHPDDDDDDHPSPDHHHRGTAAIRLCASDCEFFFATLTIT
jgi:hypothetical protein